MWKKSDNTSLIRVSNDLKDDLESLKIETWWIIISTMTDKIKHLLWHYKHYKNNNWN